METDRADALVSDVLSIDESVPVYPPPQAARTTAVRRQRLTGRTREKLRFCSMFRTRFKGNGKRPPNGSATWRHGVRKAGVVAEAAANQREVRAG